MSTKIEWTEKSWNPVTGCTKVSEACANCYAAVMTRRLKGMGQKKYANGFEVTTHPEALSEPDRWRKPCMVFVCSMGDLFHKDVPTDFLEQVMDVIERNPHITFQILTKRSRRMAEFFTTHKPPKNAWLGVTCESHLHYDRVKDLQTIKDATVRFISAEPLLDNMPDIDLADIDWVITGGESGASARKPDIQHFRSLRDAVLASPRARFFFKQWGAWGPDGVKRSKYENSHTLDGKEWHEYPLP